MTNLLKLDPRLNMAARQARAIIETPQGGRAKFNYDPETGLFELSAVLPAGMAFPMSFGFIPGTIGQDGDPLDILVLSDDTLPVGTLVPVQLIGVIEGEQVENRKTVQNDRLLGKVAATHQWADVDESSQLGKAFTGDLTKFFETYKLLRGQQYRVTNIGDAERACQLISAARTGD